MKRVLEPLAEARDDYAIFAEIAGKLGVAEAFTEGRDAIAWLRHPYVESLPRAIESGLKLPPFDEFWAAGVLEYPLPERSNALLRSDRGAILVGVVVMDAIRPGVVQLSTGAWYDPLEPGQIGSLDKRGNPNVLTPDRGSSRLGQGCAAQSTLVGAERWTLPLPPVTAHEPPPFVQRDRAPGAST